MIITKIHIHNTESLENNSKVKLSRKSKIGSTILPILAISTALAINSTLLEADRDQRMNDIHFDSPAITMSVDVQDINALNIILNDNDCSDVFFDEVVDHLQDDGIELTVTKGGDIVNQDNATIITIDQQYNAGSDTVIFAPYDNARVGHSDSLALSMKTGFQQEGVQVRNLLCGHSGYNEDENGNVRLVVPTNTESQIDEDCDSSFVTIALGTENQDPELVAKGIENGLARQNIYLKSDDNQTDLIYRANPGDSFDVVADYFGTDANTLRSYNEINSSEFKESETVINPYVDDMRAFDYDREIQIIGKDVKVH